MTADDAIKIVFTVKRSRRRRTLALQVQPSGAVIVYAPHSAWDLFIDRFVQKHRDWILKKLHFVRTHPVPPPLTREEQIRLTEETKQRLPAVVAACAGRLGVSPRSVRVANQNRRWGSCSHRGDVRFSYRMGRLPAAVFEYIVVHELAHIKQMNHSRRFWEHVASLVPDYKAHRASLRKEVYP